MQIKGRLVDIDTLEGLEAVTIGVVDAQGKYIGDMTVSDTNGKFLLNNQYLTVDGNNYVFLTSVGYEPVMVDPVVFTRSDIYALQRKPVNLDQFTVNPADNPPKVSKALWWLIGGFVVYRLIK